MLLSKSHYVHVHISVILILLLRHKFGSDASFLKGILTSSVCADVLCFVLGETLSPHADAACWGTACFCFLTDRPFGGPPMWRSSQIAPFSLHQRSDRTLSEVLGRPEHNDLICFHSYLNAQCTRVTLKCTTDISV